LTPAQITTSAPTELQILAWREKGVLAEKVTLRPRLIDLFAGAGGMTAGFTRFENHVYEPVWANDFDAAAAATFQRNFGHMTHGDIVSLLEDPEVIVPSADVVIGGPPCQGFSLLNKERTGDPRRHLWIPFLEVVERSGAAVFVMENVPQLIGSPEHDAIIERAAGMGFATKAAILCAADYGVPQTRYRAIIVGGRDQDPAAFFPPTRTHRQPDESYHRSLFNGNKAPWVEDAAPWRTVRDVIVDLVPPTETEIREGIEPPLDLHIRRNPTSKSQARYRVVPEGGNRFDLQRKAPGLTPGCWIRKTSGGTDLFGRLWWDRPSVTVRTEFFKPEKGRYLHPEQHRPITHREAARIQTFPDRFHFVGNKTDIAKQIGNAVPPMLAARLADVALAMLLARG
jgi:DNA (cytosine-5)-methyltransferase 1